MADTQLTDTQMTQDHANSSGYPSQTPRITMAQLAKEFPQLIEQMVGNTEMPISGVSSAAAASATSLVYVSAPQHVAGALQSPSRVILTSKKIWEQMPADPERRFLLSPNPELAFAFITRKFFSWNIRQSVWWQGGVHPSSVIAPGARLEEGVIIGPHSTIGPNCRIERGVYIGSNTVLEEGVKIGSGSIIHSQVFIGHGCEIGRECDILPQCTIGSEGYGYAHSPKGEHVRIPQMGRVVIEDRVDIGAGCAIDRGALEDTRIGEGTKLDNLCHIAHNTIIGKHCLLTAMLVVGGSGKIGDHVITGGRVSIIGHKTVTHNVHLAAHTAVGNSILEPGEYGGRPVQPLRDYLKTTASLSHLPEMRKDIRRLLKRVFGDSE